MTDKKKSISDSINLSVFNYFKLRSIKCLFVTIIMLFLIFLILTIFYANYLLMKALYDAINESYFTKVIVLPNSNRSANFTQALNIRIKTIEEMLLESKLMNMRMMTQFVINHQIKYEPPLIIESSIDNNLFKNQSLYQKDFYISFNKDYSGSDVEWYREKFLSLSYFFTFFHENSQMPFNIEELAVVDYQKLYMLTYCKSFQKYNHFLSELITNTSAKEKIINDAKSYNFVDYIVKNSYSTDNYMNYVKILNLTVVQGLREAKFLFLLRLNANSIKKMLNKQDRDIIILFHHENLAALKSSYNFMPASPSFDYFFTYGLKNTRKDTSSIFQSQFFADLYYENSNIQEFFYLLTDRNFSDTSLDSYYYNTYLQSEFSLIGTLFNYVLINFFGNQNLIPHNITHKNCRDDDPNYSAHNAIICDVFDINPTDIVTYDMRNLSLPSRRTNSSSKVINDFYSIAEKSLNITIETKFLNATIYYKGGVFEQDSSDVAKKKFLMYKRTINNLEIAIIEMVYIEQYLDIKIKFISKMTTNVLILSILLIFFCALVFSISLLITLFAIDSMLLKLNKMISIKKIIFYSDAFIISMLGCKNKEDIELSERCRVQAINEKEKNTWIYEDKFNKQLIAIVCETKYHLSKLLERMDNGKQRLI